MRTRVGLAIAPPALRAVAVRRGHVLWAIEAELGPGEPLADAVRVFLRGLPRSRGLSRRTCVVLAPPLAQLKVVAGLPRAADASQLAAMVRENADRLFAWHGRRVATGRVRIDETGRTWAAAYDADVVSAVVAACGAEGLRVSAIVAETALADAADRAAREGAVDAIGPDARRFAAAYVAATAGDREMTRLAIGGGAGGAERAPVPRWRLGLAGAALALAIAGAAAAPGLAAHRDAGWARTVVAELGARDRAARAAERELARVSSALETIARFRAERASSLEMLAELTQLLPPDAAVTTLRIDSAGGSLVAVAPHAGALVKRIDRSRIFVAPTLVGPVSRDVVGGREMERVTIAFRLGGHGTRENAVTGSRR
jgi:type IV pilus assembly PilN-like protein